MPPPVASPKSAEDVTKTDAAKDAWIEESNAQNGSSTFMTVFNSYDEELVRAAEARLRRKVDARVLPLIVLIYLFTYLDRNSITQVRLYGLQRDAGVKGAQYQTAISFFSASHIVMQLPSAMLMAKLRLSLYLRLHFGCEQPVWSSGVAVCAWYRRGPVLPRGYLLSQFVVRMALLICGLLLSNTFAGLISAGILSGMAGVGNLAAWQWLFILEGIATVQLGILAMIVLPDFPGTTKWLSEPERVIAQAHLAVDAGSPDLLDEEKVPMVRVGKPVHRDQLLKVLWKWIGTEGPTPS
ncbi:uncharacterized protein BDV17DRAFT_296792 [Aspergillus undulatus]|uniref:uncharacterized protein n=1 Tax=Aspergillus undulatus TaxID=1810928 RepID=UPI003CCD0981